MKQFFGLTFILVASSSFLYSVAPKSGEELYDQLISAIRNDSMSALLTTISHYKQKKIHLDAYRDAAQATPLMYAALLGKKDIVAQLIKEGSDPRAQDLVDQTAISYAKKGFAEAQKLNDGQRVTHYHEIISMLDLTNQKI